MKLKRKIISFLLAATMAVTSASAVFAADNFDKVIFDLQTYGIMTGDEDGNLNLDESVTRAEFCAITVRLLNMEKTVQSMQVSSAFSDVEDDHWAKNYIVYLNGMNVINGTSATTFDPNGTISTAAAAKILVNTLGYSVVAEEKGGYPSGYLAQAGELGLLTGITGQTESLSRKDVAKMVYNALDVDIMTITNTSGMGPVYEVQKGKTLRSMFKDTDSSVLVKLEGIVTATPHAYMDSPVIGMEDNEIEINGKIYRHNLDSVEQFLGQKIYFYVYGEGGSDILSIMASEDNETFEYPVKYLKTAADSSISFYKGDNISGAKTHKLETDAVLIKNNQAVYGWTIQDVQDISRGSIKLIDNDDDGRIEVIIAREYESVIVDEVMVDTLMVYFRNGFELRGKKYLDLDPEENINKNLSIRYADGSSVNIADLKQGDVFTAYVSDDNSMIEIVVSQNTTEGRLDTIAKETVTIDGKEFDLEDKDKELEVKAGDIVKAYINYNNEVVFMEKDTVADNYAYVVRAFSDDDNNVMLKITTPRKLAGKVEESYDDNGKLVTTNKIACKNEELKTMTLDDKVNYNGKKMDAEDVMDKFVEMKDISDAGRVITYYTNTEGKINRITKAEQIGKSSYQIYNSTEMTFGKGDGDPYGVSNDTLTLCVPEANDNEVYNPSNDDYLVSVEMNNNQQYNIKAFDKDKDTHVAQVVLVTMPMKAGIDGAIKTTSDVGIVTEVYQAVNEYGEVVTNLTMFGKGDKQAKQYEISDTLKDTSMFDNLIKGDVIAYSLNTDDQLDNCEVLISASTYDDEPKFEFEQTNHEIFMGYIEDIEYSEVSNRFNRWMDTLDCVLELDGPVVRQYKLFSRNQPPTFIYYKNQERIEKAELKQISLGSDKVAIYTSNDTVRAIVAIR